MTQDLRLTLLGCLLAAAGGGACHQDLGSNPDASSHDSSVHHGPGALIAYIRDIGLGSTKGLYVANRDGSGEQMIYSNAGVVTPTWSPDGARIAFMMLGDLNVPNLIDRDGQNHTSLVLDGVANIQRPKWSPDGQRLVFEGTPSGLYTANVSGGTATLLVSGAASSPAWSPDGSQVAYRFGTDALWVVNADGTNPHQIAGSLQQFFTPGIAWSPDGAVIAFCLGDFEADVWTVSPAGGTPHQLTTAAGGEYNLSFSPDGTKLAMYHFVDTSHYGIYELTLGSGALAPLVPSSEDPAYQP